MKSLTVRLPRISFDNGFERHWYDNKPAITHIFNAWSLIFPHGEKFFIDSAKRVSKQVDLIRYPELKNAIEVFLCQEALHSNLHEKYNTVLEKQGFKNIVEPVISKLNKLAKRLSPLTTLSIVCGYEHYTAIIGGFILSHPEMFKLVPKNIGLMWGWHFAEEIEHKATCYDLYTVAGGGWVRRALGFLQATIHFVILILTAYLYLMHRDGNLHVKKLPASIFDFSSFLFGRYGLGWKLFKHAFLYLKPGFHPNHIKHQQILDSWLKLNQEDLTEVLKKDKATQFNSIEMA